MSRQRNYTRRLADAVAVASAANKTVFRHPDGRTLGLADAAVVDSFLSMPTDGRLPFSAEAVRFLAECEVSPTAPDIERGLIEQARAQIAGSQAPQPPPAPTPRERLERLIVRLDAMQARAPSAAVAREIRSCLAAVAELQDEPPTFDLLRHPDYIALRSALLDALAPYPEARVAAAAALCPELAKPLFTRIPPALSPYRREVEEDPLA